MWLKDVSTCQAYTGDPWWPRCVRLAKPDHAAQNAHSCLLVAQGQPQEMLHETWQVGSKRQPCLCRETGVRSGTLAAHTHAWVCCVACSTEAAASSALARSQASNNPCSSTSPYLGMSPRAAPWSAPALLQFLYHPSCRLGSLRDTRFHLSSQVSAHPCRLQSLSLSSAFLMTALLTSDQHQVQVQQHCRDRPPLRTTSLTSLLVVLTLSSNPNWYRFLPILSIRPLFKHI